MAIVMEGRERTIYRDYEDRLPRPCFISRSPVAIVHNLRARTTVQGHKVIKAIRPILQSRLTAPTIDLARWQGDVLAWYYDSL
jgi:hypothetical protein